MEGYIYLGSNDHKAPYPKKQEEINQLIISGTRYYFDDKKKFGLNEAWYDYFGEKEYPNFIDKCTCGKNPLKYNHYFYDPKTCHFKILGSACAKKYLGVTTDRQLAEKEHMNIRICDNCNMPFKASELRSVCKTCDPTGQLSYFCEMCDTKVCLERVKTPCELCDGGYIMEPHSCYDKPLQHIPCKHIMFKCETCDAEFLKGTHFCHEYQVCNVCDAKFDLNIKHQHTEKGVVNSILCSGKGEAKCLRDGKKLFKCPCKLAKCNRCEFVQTLSIIQNGCIGPCSLIPEVKSFMLGTVLRSGKYEGFTWKEVYDKDRPYFKWLVNHISPRYEYLIPALKLFL